MNHRRRTQRVLTVVAAVITSCGGAAATLERPATNDTATSAGSERANLPPVPSVAPEERARVQHIADLEGALAQIGPEDPRRGDALLALADALRESALPGLPGIDRGVTPSSGVEVARRERLIAVYSELFDRAPHHQRADEAAFYLAYTFEAQHRMTDARRFYLALIRNHPNSRFAPLAFVAFGDFFFEEESWPEARQFYDHSLRMNDLDPGLHAYANYRLAWVMTRLNDANGALRFALDALDDAFRAPDDPTAARVAQRVRAEAPAAYIAGLGAMRLDAREALRVFARLAPDPSAATDMLAALGEQLAERQRWIDAEVAYRAAIARATDPTRVATWQARAATMHERATAAGQPE